jgi:hypothetical protein
MRESMPHPHRWIAPLLISFVLACVADSGSDAGPYVRRDTLANGALRIHYARLPEDRVATVAPGLRLGGVDGDPNLVFGDVRGVDAGADGRIYVLDYQASEIRAFDRSGAFLHTVASRGQGPGELGEANGMILVGDTMLWVQDHGQWMMIGLSLEGGEISRVPMHVLAWGFVWEGTVDNTGRIWKPDYREDEERTFAPDEGLNEITVGRFLKSLDPVTNAIDSVYLGDDMGRAFVTRLGSSGSQRLPVPFDPERLTKVDPDGGFWQVHSAAYRVARLNEAGDTTLLVEVDVDPVPVEGSERQSFIDQVGERGGRGRHAAEAVAALMPDTKPVIRRLIVDDEGRLWVERAVPAGADPRYDVFDRDGEFLGSVALAFTPDQTRRSTSLSSRLNPIRIRHGHIYAVVLNEMDVPSVVRADVPDVIRNQGS